MPIGRPTVLTPSVISKIAQCFFDGFTDSDTAFFCSIDEKTIRRARNGGFCPEIKMAELAKKKLALEKIRTGVGANWQGMAWFLERRYPKEFSRPEIQLSLQNNYTQNNLSINISKADAKEIESEAAPVRTKIEGMFKAYRPQIGNGNGGEKHDDASSNK